MNYQFSKRSQIPQSATAVISSIAQAKRAAGESVYDLGIGEPVIPPHQIIVDAIAQAVADAKTGYPPVSGYASLREAASQWYNSEYGSAFTPEQTLITPGGKMALYMLLQSLLDTGDEVIVVAPYWVSYPAQVRLAGGVSKQLLTTEATEWKITPEQLKSAITNRTKLIIFNNGCNPTGTSYTSQELFGLAKAANEAGCLLISDEVYSGLTFDGRQYNSMAAFNEFADNIIITQSISKHFALTGLRIGIVYAPEEIVSTLKTLQGQTTHSAASLSQAAAEAAFKNADEIISVVRKTVELRRNHLFMEIKRLWGRTLKRPTTGLYGFIAINNFTESDITDIELAERLINETGTAVVPGSAFGTEGYLRISFGAPEDQITAGLEAMHSLLK